jgi:hypothetical protein
MMILQGPVPGLTTTCVFPNPDFGDSESPRSTMTTQQSMNGTLYSYVKSNTRSRLQYTLTLSRMKALELRAFITSYYRATVRLTNHKGEVWDVSFTSNPFEFTSKEKSSDPGDATVTITLEFEGLLIQGVTPSTC